MDTAEESFRDSIRRAESEAAGIKKVVEQEREHLKDSEAMLKRAEAVVAEKKEDLAEYIRKHGVDA
jgi:hypothetical protein